MMNNRVEKIKHVNVWFEGRIQAYLKHYCDTHPEWEHNIANEDKNIIDCVNYILWKTSKAHYNPETDCTPCASQEEQYGWALEYYEDTDLKNEDIKSPFADKQKEVASKPKADGKKKKEEKKDDGLDLFASVKMEVSKENPEDKVIAMTPDAEDDDDEEDDDDLFDL